MTIKLSDEEKEQLSCSNPPESCMLLSRRISDRDHAVRELQQDMITLKDALTESNKQTAEIIEIYKGMKILILMLKSVGFIAKWIVTIAAATGIIWALWKYGILTVVTNANTTVGK